MSNQAEFVGYNFKGSSSIIPPPDIITVHGPNKCSIPNITGCSKVKFNIMSPANRFFAIVLI